MNMRVSVQSSVNTIGATTGGDMWIVLGLIIWTILVTAIVLFIKGAAQDSDEE